MGGYLGHGQKGKKDVWDWRYYGEDERRHWREEVSVDQSQRSRQLTLSSSSVEEPAGEEQ